MDCFVAGALRNDGVEKVARAALGGTGGSRARFSGGGWGASSISWRQWTNAWRRLNANRIRLNMSKITPAIMRSSASVAVFGSWTVSGAAVTTGAGFFNAAT